MLFLSIVLALSAWHGSDLPTATQAAAKYRLTLTGQPGETVHLKTSGVERGWIAAFCDNRVCSPHEVTETIPAAGKVAVQFELIREEDTAPRRSAATITGDNGSVIKVPAASR